MDHNIRRNKPEYSLTPPSDRQRQQVWGKSDAPGQRWARFRDLVHRKQRWTHARLEFMSAVILAIFLPLWLLTTVVQSQQFSVESPTVEYRSLGDPDRGRERILAENFTTIQNLNELADDPRLSDFDRMLYRHAPVILLYEPEFPLRENTPIGVYYTVTSSQSGDSIATTIRYFLWFVDEGGGMPIERRLSLFGHSLDRELVYRVTLLGDQVVGAYYQAPGHRQIVMNYDGESRPVFSIASANHNFRQVFERELSDPSDKILLAPLPHLESPQVPAHDPDFAVLAVHELWEKYQIDVRSYVFVELILPSTPTPVTVSVRIDDRWFYLHEQVGGGVRRPGYNQAGVYIGYPTLPGDIREVRIIAYSDDDLSFDSMRISIYPPTDLPV